MKTLILSILLLAGCGDNAENVATFKKCHDAGMTARMYQRDFNGAPVIYCVPPEGEGK